MSHKLKSILYFTSLMLAIVTYSHISNETIQNTELAANAVEHVATDEALN